MGPRAEALHQQLGVFETQQVSALLLVQPGSVMCLKLQQVLKVWQLFSAVFLFRVLLCTG